MSASLLDVARGTYVRLPLGVRRYLGVALGGIPSGLRLGRAYSDTRALIARARRDPGFARREQKARLLRVIEIARAQSPYYRELFDGIFGSAASAEDIVRPENWARIPILTTPIIRREVLRLCTKPASELDPVTTGGTSGQPVPFYLDKGRSPIEYAYVMDLWTRAGCGPNDWRAWFRGWQSDVDHALRHLRLSVFHLGPDDLARCAQEIQRRNIVFLQGYPSAITTFAAFLLRENHPLRHSIRGLMLHSEPFHPEYRTVVEQAFPQAVLIPFYGLSEKCAFGAEVDGQRDVYDMNPLYGFTELVDREGEPLTEPGRAGRIVSTGLQFTGMPFIRYETGDEATLVESPCEANGYRLRIAEIVPREGHRYLATRSGKSFINTLSLVMGDSEMRAVTGYQFEQDTPGEVRMRFVLAEGASPAIVESYVRSVNRRLGGELTVIPEIVPSIPLTEVGKRRLVIQRLDVSDAIPGRHKPAVDSDAPDAPSDLPVRSWLPKETV